MNTSENELIMYYDGDQKKFITIVLDAEDAEQEHQEAPKDRMGYKSDRTVCAFV